MCERDSVGSSRRIVTPFMWPYPPPAAVSPRTPCPRHPKGRYHAPPGPRFHHVCLCRHHCSRKHVAAPFEGERPYAVVPLTVKVHAFMMIEFNVWRSSGSSRRVKFKEHGWIQTGSIGSNGVITSPLATTTTKDLPGACLPVCFVAMAAVAVSERRKKWCPVAVRKAHRRKRKQQG